MRAMESASSTRPAKNEIHCSACSRLVLLGEGAREGDVVTCPFCHQKMVVKLMTVYVGEPLVEA